MLEWYKSYRQKHKQRRLYVAICRNDPRGVILALSHGADPNAEYGMYRPLRDAITKGSLPIVQALLLFGANPVVKDPYGVEVHPYLSYSGLAKACGKTDIELYLLGLENLSRPKQSKSFSSTRPAPQ